MSEATARAAKVDRLLAAIAAHADHAGVAVTADEVENWPETVWGALAALAGTRMASPTTRRCVVAVLRDRENHPDPFDGLSGGGCTGERPQAPEWSGDVVHDGPCPEHPDAEARAAAGREAFYGGRR